MAGRVVTLAPGVIRIPTMGDFINSYAFLEDDGSVTLVDCGLDRAPARIVEGLQAVGRHPRDVQRIVLTHAHYDHAGGAHAMLEQTGLPGIQAHADDAGFLRTGENPPIDTSTTSGRLFARGGGGTFRAVPVSRELHDGDVVDVAGGLRVVHTPGHTPGHISLLHESSGVLITGDSIFNLRALRTWPFAAFCTDYAQCKRTAGILGDLDFDIAAFTHGPEIRVRAREEIRRFLTRKGVRA